MNNKLDKLLYEALKECDAPSPALNRQIINMAYLEEKKMKHRKKYRTAAAIITLCITLAGGGTAYAAYRHLTSGEIVKTAADNDRLAKAFDSTHAISIHEAQISGDYVFELLGLVSGSDLELYVSDELQEQLSDKRTYAALAISKKDGSAMPSKSFCVSPLIGNVPFEIANNATLKTSLIWFEQDGILYELMACEDLEIFADRGVWLSVVENFGDEAAAYSFTKDGAYAKNEAYRGISALFKIPFDETNADKAAADTIIKKLENQLASADEEASLPSASLDAFADALSEISADDIPEYFTEVSAHTVTSRPDADGYIDLTCMDGNFTCGVNGQIDAFIDDTEDFSVLNIFEDNASAFGFTAIFRNADGSFTFKEFRKN